ncbi:Fumarylacetoacetase [Paramyrothecium foliicola]|nr:Fumarylacetoacetase [Paramyrothecium foliicola]
MSSSWLSIPDDSLFSIDNIPFGIISTTNDPTQRPAIAIGDHALDLAAFAAGNGFAHLPLIQSHLAVFNETTLNGFAALGRPVHRQVRGYLQEVLTENGKYATVLQNNANTQNTTLIPRSNIKNYIPLHIGDYTDFYAGLNHAYNVGVLFRGHDNALQPNYKYLPVSYHGRASSAVVSGTPVRHPIGQILADPTSTLKLLKLSPSKKLDIELELAAFVCTPNKLGKPIPIASAEEHIFWLVLMNDWSARDIQAWEYVPLGPFTSKNFCTTISPWVVLVDALEPFRATSSFLDLRSPEKVLPYLVEPRSDTFFDISLTVELRKNNSAKAKVISNGNTRDLFFSFPQMLAHHSITGCNMRIGDILGSGTISSIENNSLGSLLEATKNGKEPITLDIEGKRTFLEDGDEVIISGRGGKESRYVGFGECAGVILLAMSLAHII